MRKYFNESHRKYSEACQKEVEEMSKHPLSHEQFRAQIKRNREESERRRKESECQRIEKHIIRVVHLIHPEHLFQAAFIETAVMRNERKPFNHRGDLLPHMWEYRGAFRIFLGESVNLLAEPLIVLRFGVNQAVVRIHYLAITDDDHSNAADAGTTLIGALEVYGGKRFQIREFLDMQR